MKGYLTYKKGSITFELILIILVVLALGIMLPSLFNLYSEIEPELIDHFNETGSENNVSIAMVQDFGNDFPSMWDSIFIIILFVFVGAAVVAAFFLDDNPIFFIIAVLALIFILIISAYLGNMYEESLEDEFYSDVSTDFPMMYWVGTHLFQVMLMAGGLILLALYGKSRMVE